MTTTARIIIHTLNNSHLMEIALLLCVILSTRKKYSRTSQYPKPSLSSLCPELDHMLMLEPTLWLARCNQDSRVFLEVFGCCICSNAVVVHSSTLNLHAKNICLLPTPSIPFLLMITISEFPCRRPSFPILLLELLKKRYPSIWVAKSWQNVQLELQMPVFTAF